MKRATPVSTVTSAAGATGGTAGCSVVPGAGLTDSTAGAVSCWGATAGRSPGAESDTSEGGDGAGAKKIDHTTTTTSDSTIARTARLSISTLSYLRTVTSRGREIYTTA